VAISLGVIGLGRMAQSLLLPLLERGDFSPDEIFGVVRKKESIKKKLSQLPEGIRVVSADDPLSVEVWSAPIKILAVKPQQFSDIEENLNQLDQTSSQKPLLISLLAGVPLGKLQEAFKGHVCVRAVPNTPVVIKQGLTGLAWGEEISIKQRLRVKEIFNPISEVFEFPEYQLDAFLALTSSGPAYVALMTEALADGAVAAGLPRSAANYLSHRTLYGTSLLLKEKNWHPGELKDMVASPGGTTITALRHLEMVGLRSALIEAVVLAAERSRELA
tara:strand:- start:98 stop:922 length:825 start_codon:yes stop_codon:yes gene_type:complete